MENLKLVLTHMAYGAALWLVLFSTVAGIWYGLFRWAEYRRKVRFIRAWNQWMGFTK